ncbi:MAG TPA: GAF domain-containing protein [Alphaproteobacteria bacterium]|nr:GAF domain-containing protein [Alphaproteobacteria bacterium]
MGSALRSAFRLSAIMAFPILHRSDLIGALLVGDKRARQVYRPDEINNLARAANQVGLELHTLRVEMLEQREKELSQQVAILKDELKALFVAGPREAGPRM